MEIIKKYKIDIAIMILLLAISIFFIFTKLGAKELNDWDEGLYANIVGEMIQGGDYLHLKLQNVEWLEKEPLPFWLEVISVKIFGFNTFALRFPAALLSIFIAPLVFLISRYWTNKTWSTITAILMLLSPVLWKSHMLKTADFDLLAIVFFLASFASYIYLRDKKGWWLAPLFIAFGLMSRGAIGGVHVGIILLAELSRPLFNLKRWSIKKILTFLIIALLPWLGWHIFLLATSTEAYIDIYWKEQFFSRITDPLQGHRGTIWHYYDFFKSTLGLKYLLLFLFSTIIVSVRLFLKKEWKSLFLLIWLLLTILPPHFIQTKLYWYMAPVIPVLYIMSAYGIFIILNKIKNSHKPYVNILLIILIIPHALLLAKNLVYSIRNIKESSLQTFIASNQLKTTQNQDIIVYNIYNWNFGRVLPNMYWYMKFEKEWNPVLIDDGVLKNYIELKKEFPYWFTNEKGLEKINNLVDKEDYNIITKIPGHISINFK